MKAHFTVANALRSLIAATSLFAASGTAIADSTVSLTAGPTATTLPDGQMVPMWGYTCDAPPVGATCTTLNGDAQTAGWQPPLITVPAGKLTIHLTNSLQFAGGNIPTSLVIVGQLGGGLGDQPTRMPSPPHAPQGTTWPGTLGAADAGVSSVTVTAGGSGYAVNDPVSFTGDGSGALGHVSAVSGTGEVTQVTIDAAGSGYTVAPNAVFGGTGTGAAGRANMNSSGNEDAPTFTGPAQADRVRSFATEVVPGTPQDLVWNNLRPGTYLIHSGTQPSIQHPMGLYGVVVVTDPDAPGVAYGTAYDNSVALLMSEIDSGQNAAVDLAVRTPGFNDSLVWNAHTGQCGDPAVHTCYPPAVNYSPLYYLVNGVSFDRSNLAASTVIGSGDVATSGNLLLRLVNAGLRAHTPEIVNATMTELAEDANKLPGAPRLQSHMFMAPGKTKDVTIAPKQTVAGTYDNATFAFYDRMLGVSTNNERDGGMQAYIKVADGAAAGAAGSGASAVTAKANADSYSVVAEQPLTIRTVAKGLVANDIGVYGVAVQTAPANGTVTLSANGTFTYVPNSGFTGDSFVYCGNGTTVGDTCATVTLNVCTGTCLGLPPTATADAYTSNLASALEVARPGVLNNDSDPSGFDLAAADAANVDCGSVSVATDGSFSATKGANASCSFTYKAKNAQGTSSTNATVTVTFPAASNLAVTVKDAKDGAKTVGDYRWIIEEDRTIDVDPAEESKPLCKDNASLSPPACSTRAVRNLAINFHAAHTPVIAQGCTGPISCEAGQKVLGNDAACDAYGRCTSDATQKAVTLPGDVALDPTKRYFISVLPGDAADPLNGPGGCDFNDALDSCVGHAMGGAQIAAGQTAVDVIVQPLPIQTATFHVFIFEDDNPLNGENDTGGGVDVLAPNEPGLGGFNMVLLDQAGAMGGSAGQITYDMFGMPVTNALAGRVDPATGYNACPISANQDGIVGIIETCPKYESDSSNHPTNVLSPLAGHAVIANMYPGMYEVTAVAGAERLARKEQWLQTNTLDGTKAIEVFIKAGEPGYFQEFGPGGYHVAMGFANPKIIQDRKAGICRNIACNENFYGTVTATRLSRTPDQRVYSSGSYDAYGFTSCYVSISYPDSEDFDFAFCDAEGHFEFKNIPQGNFKLTVFDQNNDLLVDGLSTPIKPGSSGPGSAANNRADIPVMQWRTNLYGRVFLDQNGDGVSQANEPGLPLVPFNVRYRDGSYENFNNTDFEGYAGFNEIFPRLNWLVVDTDQARYKLTGVHAVYDAQGPVDGSAACADPGIRGCGNSEIAAGFANTFETLSSKLPDALRTPGSVYCSDADCTTENLLNPNGGGSAGSTGRIDRGWAGTQGWQGLLGSNAFLEFAMQPFKKKGEGQLVGQPGVSDRYGENGGIRGHVLFASTRPFDDPALSVQLMWTPGIPNTKVNLYKKTIDDNGVEHLTLVDMTLSTSFDAWAQGFRRNADGTFVGDAANGYVPNMSCPGQETDSPFYFTMVDGKFPLDEDKPLAERGRFKCYDGWSMASALQPAPYDGMYKFPSVVAKQSASGELPVGNPGAAGEEPNAANWFLALDPKNYKTNCSICTTNPDDGTPMLPPGVYVVEVVLPTGYELVKEEDKNILQGDAYIAPAVTQFAGFGNIFIMPDQASVDALYNPYNPLQPLVNNGASPRREGDTGSFEVFWPCVGEQRVVPDYLSLFPQSELWTPFAGATRSTCDRKEVTLSDEMTGLAKFYLFTSAHKASHFAGTITNDFASEFDPFSPQFGEKFAVPSLPVAVRDFSGREISRVYSDQWGQYNGMAASSWTVFPPSPSGYIPNTMIMCMNDPGPIADPAHPGQMITDPAYNPAYSNFCYEFPYMPGETSYLDTPVVPTASFAAGYNLPDCEYPDTTPAIKTVQNSVGTGPWIDPGVAEVRASLNFNIGGVSQQGTTATTPNDRINSVMLNSTALVAQPLRCGALVSGSTQVDCSSSSQTTRNNKMASALRAAINALTGTHGYTASGTGANVIVTAATGTGATPNGYALVFNQTGLNTVNGVLLAGGVTAIAPTTTAELTITALGDKQVLNHAYSGPNATSAPYNDKFVTRHYGFGSTPGSVTIGGITATVDTWTDSAITVTVPGTVPDCSLQQRGAPSARCGELEITAANGKKTIDAITVTVGGNAPIYVTPTAVTYPAGYAPIDTDAAFGRLEPSPLQSAIDNAKPGDLIIVGPGTYRDNLLMWKPVRLQGVGAESVTINADAHPAGKMDAWRREVNCLFGLSLDGRPLLNDGTGTLGTGMAYDPTNKYSCPAGLQQRVDRIPFETVVGWDTTGNGNLAQMLQEPTLMGAYEGAGVTVLGRGVRIPNNSNDFWGSATAGGFPAGYTYLTNSNTDCTSFGGATPNGRDYATANFNCNPSRIDGFSVINSSQGGGAIWAHAWNHNLEVSNNRVRANHGTLTGGITIGNGEFPDPFVCAATVIDGTVPLPFQNNCGSANQPEGYQYGYGFNVNTKVHHNMVVGNASIGDALYSGTPSAAGGVSFCSGSDGYLLDHNWVCGNLSYGDSAGVAHVGFSNDGKIKNNQILFNQSQQATLPVNGGGLGILGASPDRTLPDGTECGATSDADCPPGLPEGTGRNLLVDSNLIMGNAAESGSGGGIRIQMVNGDDVVAMPARPALWNDVTLQNNIIADNVAGWDGGGVSIQDALKVRLMNNTIVDNDTTASAGVLFKTIGAPLASTPPPGCNPGTQPGATCPDDINNVSTNQPAGVVTMSC
ncbi:MAG: hypothetical protein HY749_14800 [Gammaproteobacteria bacterium]|nr:hypothetical protein [Gammaproteobacteria bacterium]